MNHRIVAHLERRPAPRNGRLLNVRPMPPHFRPWRAESAANGPPRTEKWGHWPHVEQSAVSRRRAPLEMRNDQTYSFRDEFRRGRSATPTRRAWARHHQSRFLAVTEHRIFESLRFLHCSNYIYPKFPAGAFLTWPRPGLPGTHGTCATQRSSRQQVVTRSRAPCGARI